MAAASTRRYEVRDAETGEVLKDKFVLDIGMDDKGLRDGCARAAMHAYTQARGYDPNGDYEGYEGLGPSKLWFAIAQDLADNPERKPRVSAMTPDNAEQVRHPTMPFRIAAVMVEVPQE